MPQASRQGPAQVEAGAERSFLYFLLSMGQGLLGVSWQQARHAQVVTDGLPASGQAVTYSTSEPDPGTHAVRVSTESGSSYRLFPIEQPGVRAECGLWDLAVLGSSASFAAYWLCAIWPSSLSSSLSFSPGKCKTAYLLALLRLNGKAQAW